MLNPHKKKTKKKKGKKNPCSKRGYRNPNGAARALWRVPQRMATQEFIQDAASAAVGFTLPNVLVAWVPPQWRQAQWQVYAVKVGAVAVLSYAGSMVNRRVGRMVALGGGMLIALDLWADFVAPMAGGFAPPPEGTEHYWGTDDDSGVAASMADTW